jgi:hypothetical protein
MAAKKKTSSSSSSSKGRGKVKKVMHEYKHGELKSGRGGKGGKVKSRKQAVAIALNEARKSGARVPRKKSASKKVAVADKVPSVKFS